MVDSELGFVTESPFRRQEAKTFLFVSVNKKVVGCAVAVHISEVRIFFLGMRGNDGPS